MPTLKVGRSLKESDVLWRYLPLEKFIDLVASQSLFFSPLAHYSKSDPFEGYVPRVGMEVMASISKRFRDQQIALTEQLAQRLPKDASPQIRKLREDIESHVPNMMALHKNITACLMVNCWYGSAHESEGMWALYAKGGVAIKTSVAALRSAIIDDQQGPVVHVGTVKYLNFSDPNLKAPDCVSADGQLFGIIKRIAYAHEHEVRMYVTRERDRNSLELQKPEPIRLPVDVGKLLESVVISPFAGEATIQSVLAVCKWSGLNEAIVSKSNLLDNCEYLFDAYK